MIQYDNFAQCELRVARIFSAERVDGSEKLLKLHMSLGNEERQIVAGIGKAYDPQTLVGRQVVIIANLEPRILMGLESQGMLLAAGDGTPIILIPEKEVADGSPVH